MTSLKPPGSAMPEIRNRRMRPWEWIVVGALSIFTTMTTLFVVVAWFLPVEVFQNWAFEYATEDSYRRFEAVGQAEALCWVIRIVGPILVFGAIRLIRNRESAAKSVQRTWQGFLTATQIFSVSRVNPATSLPVTHDQRLTVNRVKTWCLRGMVFLWMTFAVVQFGLSANRRIAEWPYYKFRSGGVVLPNISESNRDVIRYLRERTPPNSRILVVSDQKLYFLSYYLRPRGIYHRVHPDSAFVIAQPHQERWMPAYRLNELDPEWICQLRPDFILEYFEHPDNIDGSKKLDDRHWVQFLRRLHDDPNYVPAYSLQLQPYTENCTQ